MDINNDNLQKMLSESSNRVRSAVGCFSNLCSRIRWKKISFIDYETPEPSHRPRLCGYRVYVPGAAKHQAYFNKHVLPTLNGLFITTPCKVDVDIYVKTPESFSNTKKCLAEMKLLRPWCGNGDIDNYLKSILDAMQPNERRGHTGIMEDDCLIISSNANKYYSITPRYEVTISYMTSIPKDLIKLFKIEK